MLDPRSITVIWPAMLWLLLAVPLVVLLYLRLMTKRRKIAQRYASLAMVGEATAKYRRHVPAALMLLGLTALIFAVSRPNAVIMLPSNVQNVMLAMDISGSMRATDIKPNRITAAQSAAKTFIEEQPSRVRIGIVSVAGAAAVVQSPTDNREDLAQAIDRVQLQRGTALGSGVLISLATLLPHAGIEVEKHLNEDQQRRPQPAALPGAATPGTPAAPAKKADARPAAPGANTSAAIVLLSDGASNTGPDPLKMAQIAADHGVRVFTVGVGTAEGAVLSTDGWSMRVRLDEDTLKKIASTTGGEYFRAGNAPDLKKIYKHLSTKLAFEKQQATEVTSLFVAMGAAFAMLGALLSLVWFNRIF